jgi:hypothetical protein
MCCTSQDLPINLLLCPWTAKPSGSTPRVRGQEPREEQNSCGLPHPQEEMGHKAGREGVSADSGEGMENPWRGTAKGDGIPPSGSLTKNISWEEHQDTHGERPQPVESQVPVPLSGKGMGVTRGYQPPGLSGSGKPSGFFSSVLGTEPRASCALTTERHQPCLLSFA